MAIEVCGFIFGQLIAHIILASMIKRTISSIGKVEQNKGLNIKEIYVNNTQAIITVLTGILSIPAIICTLERKVSRTYGEPLPTVYNPVDEDNCDDNPP